MKNKLIMTPGPVKMPQEVLDSLSNQMIHHRTPEFSQELQFCLEMLKTVFVTSNDVFIQTGTGSGGMESAIVNTLSPGDTILTIASGKFGQRWKKIGDAYGLNVVEFSVTWGETFKLSEIKEALHKNTKIKAICCQACETSTGVFHPIKELSKLLNNEQLLIVDGITAISASDLKMDEWGIDVLVGGSQKALQIPTGICFISFSQKAWKFIETSKCPKFYWDIRLEKKANEKGQTQFSSAVSHIRALKVVLERIKKNGLETRITRVKTLATATRKAAVKMKLENFAHPASPSLTTLKVPQEIDGERVVKIMSDEYGISIGGGQDQLKGKIIRLDHMGAITDEDLLFTLEKLSTTLNQMGYEHNTSDALQAAREVLGQ